MSHLLSMYLEMQSQVLRKQDLDCLKIQAMEHQKSLLKIVAQVLNVKAQWYHLTLVNQLALINEFNCKELQLKNSNLVTKYSW